MSLTDMLATVGGFTLVFYLLKLAWRCWCGFREYVLSEHWQVDLRTYGQWAVVTGATSGIGKAYASELAQRGLNVILVSRSEDKLRMVAKEIENEYGRKTRTIQVDFTEGHSIYPAIAKELEGLEIGILVNNVGMIYTDSFACFLETPDAEQKITQVINCNVLSVPQMTRLVLPDMIERGTGLIINISSAVGVRPQPLLALYSATKIFVKYFSQCLHAEYKSKGISVQCVVPVLVSTNMTHNMEVNRFVKSAPEFAREALNTVGHSSYTSGCLSHALQNVALTVLFPDWFRMSTFLIRNLKKLPKMGKSDRRVCKENQRDLCSEDPMRGPADRRLCVSGPVQSYGPVSGCLVIVTAAPARLKMSTSETPPRLKKQKRLQMYRLEWGVWNPWQWVQGKLCFLLLMDCLK